MVDTLRSLARPGGHKAFDGDEAWKKVTSETPKRTKRKVQSIKKMRREEGESGVKSAARPVLGIRGNAKNRPGRLTKEALIAVDSRECASRLESSLLFLFCLLICFPPTPLTFSFCLFFILSLSLFTFPRSFFRWTMDRRRYLRYIK